MGDGKSLRKRDVERIRFETDDLADGRTLSDGQRVELSLGVIKAKIQLLQQSEEWLRRGLVEEISLNAPSPKVAIARVQSSGAQADVKARSKFSEALPAFVESMTNEQGWRGQTLAQNQTTYRMFVECCGDRPVAQYERRDLTQFYDLLRGLPALYFKSKEWSGLSLAEFVEHTKGSDQPRLTMKTICGWPLCNSQVAAFRRPLSRPVAQRLGVRLPFSVAELLIDQGSCESLIEANLCRGFLPRLMNFAASDLGARSAVVWSAASRDAISAFSVSASWASLS